MKIDSTKETINPDSNKMDYSTKTRAELIALCKQQNHTGYSSKTKTELIEFMKRFFRNL